VPTKAAEELSNFLETAAAESCASGELIVHLVSKDLHIQ
jgi:hypothetical protein